MRSTGDFKEHMKVEKPEIVRINDKSNHSNKVLPFTLRYFQNMPDNEVPTCDSGLSPTDSQDSRQPKIASNYNLSKRPLLLDRNHHCNASLN